MDRCPADALVDARLSQIANDATLRERLEAAEAERRNMHRRAQIAEGRLYRMLEYLNLWRDSQSGDYWFRSHIDNIIKCPRKDSGAWRTLLWCFWRRDMDDLRAQLTEARAIIRALRRTPKEGKP